MTEPLDEKTEGLALALRFCPAEYRDQFLTALREHIASISLTPEEARHISEQAKIGRYYTKSGCDICTSAEAKLRARARRKGNDS